MLDYIDTSKRNNLLKKLHVFSKEKTKAHRIHFILIVSQSLSEQSMKANDIADGGS